MNRRHFSVGIVSEKAAKRKIAACFDRGKAVDYPSIPLKALEKADLITVRGRSQRPLALKGSQALPQVVDSYVGTSPYLR
jgi:hypothetical protein